MKKPRILIADNHPLVLDGFRRLLDKDYKVVGAVRDGPALVVAAKQTAPDLVLLDVNLGAVSGYQAAKELRGMCPAAKIVFVSMHATPFHVVEAIKAGASGYILKTSELIEVLTAIRKVLAGEKYISPALAHSTLELIAHHTVLQRDDTLSKLTARQKDVLKLLAEGKALKEIADALHISVKTVEFHKRELCDRVGLRTTAELTRLAVADGLIPAHPRALRREDEDDTRSTGTA